MSGDGKRKKGAAFRKEALAKTVKSEVGYIWIGVEVVLVALFTLLTIFFWI